MLGDSLSPRVIRLAMAAILFCLGTYVQALPFEQITFSIVLAMVVVTMLSCSSSFILIWRRYGRHPEIDRYPSWSSPLFKNRLPLQDEFDSAWGTIIAGCGGMLGAYPTRTIFSGWGLIGIVWGIGVLLSIRMYLSWSATSR